MPTLRHIPIRSIGTSEVHVRYLDEDPDLQPFLGMRPRSLDDLLRRAPVNARRLLAPDVLATALDAYARRHDAPEPVLEAIGRVGDGRASMVVTGQQPGLFGGPLYGVHKAATAVRLARDLSAVPGAPDVVPIFWNHTDDHDLDEVNRAFFVNTNLEVQRVRLDLDRAGECIRSVAVGRSMDHALAAVGDLLPHSEYREWALAIFQARTPNEHLGDIMARLMFAIFGKYGLLVIEPRDLPAEAFEVLPRWLEQAEDIRSQVRANQEHLTDVGVDPTLDPGATLMFQHQGGRRLAMADDDPVQRATDLSPGALLRPLWQDACLPSVGFVVGPGELAYLSVAGPLYRTLGVPTPLFVPRATLTLVEPSLAKLLKRFDWDLPDLDRGVSELAESVATMESNNDEGTLDRLSKHLASEMTELAKNLENSEPQMVRAVERTRGKIQEELKKLQVKLRNQRNNKQGTGMRQIRRLCSSLRPKGRLQERVLTTLPFLAAHGEMLADHLVEAADPFINGHGVLEL
ncbi:MAG: bacillithiol biosynthesis protein BshC [Planctomycetota bacterium]|jgi:uncharacterized protein YllA (UPF0747 family)